MIKLENIEKYYNRGSVNQIHVINNINLQLPENGMVAIFGRSGCGKTTLLNTIGGLDKIDRGEITIFGEDISKNTDKLRNKYIGYIFQNYNLCKNQNVFENVANALTLCGMKDEKEIYKRVMQILRDVGMDKFYKRFPDTLSGGQQQRVAIARAIVKNPALILADEPTGNLDENNTILIMDILKKLSRNHLVLLVTHEENLVDCYCDKVIEVCDGRIASVRENQSAEGLLEKKKSDIYLGEFSKKESENNGVKIEYYGPEKEEIRLKIVNVNGVLYLKSETPSLKFLDSSSEIKLIEGVFKPKTQNEEIQNSFNIEEMPKLNSKKMGRMFSFGSSIISGYRSNFRKNGKKRGKLLHACMILLAFVSVLVTSFFATSIQKYNEVSNSVPNNVFYIPVKDNPDTSFVHEKVGEYGIEYTMLETSLEYINYNIFLSFGNFQTIKNDSISFSGKITDIKAASKLSVESGRKEINNNDEMVITTAVADKIIKEKNLDYLKNYSNFLNFVAKDDTNMYYNGNRDFVKNVKVVGVVRSKEENIFFSSISVTKQTLTSAYGSSINLFCDSDSSLNSIPVEKGHISIIGSEYTLNDENGSRYAVGDSILILGKSYIVSEVKIENQLSLEENNEFFGNKFIFNEEDYLTFSSFTAKTDNRILSKDYANYDLYISVHSSNYSQTEDFLNKYYKEINTPKDLLKNKLSYYSAQIIKNLISLFVVLGLLILCIFLIMRSSMLGKIKEIGVYRAIGVSKKNIIFRFMIEALVLVTLTLLIGYIIGTVIVTKICSYAMLSSFLYFPFWLAGILLILLYGVSVLFGILPVWNLLRKTPSEILAKYDI